MPLSAIRAVGGRSVSIATEVSNSLITHSETLEDRLIEFKEVLGGDYEGYRGHLYRVLNYALYFLDGDETHRSLIETALVYHDIAVWTVPEMAYLEPSVELALEHNAEKGWGYDPQLLSDTIYWHHKITPFRGPNKAVVNAVRKGDWIDATGGKLRKGVSRERIAETYKAIPVGDFYKVLGELGERFYPGNKWAAMRAALRVFKL